MADLESLKKRVDLVDLRLKAAHSARERESSELMQVWEQIREKCLEQNAEIVRLRECISGLEDTRDELLGMVHGLLAAVEGNLQRMSDGTVPRIREMASSLLDAGSVSTPARGRPRRSQSAETQARPQPVAPRQTLAREPEDSNFHEELLNAIEQSLEEADDYRSAEETDRPVEPTRVHRSIAEPASPGIRDLIARIEGAVGPDLVLGPPLSGEDEGADDELTRDLHEIEALRGELHGLRERLSGASR